MLRTLFIVVSLSLYILILGPPLLLFTLITRHIDPLYWTGLKGVIFFVRAVGVRVRVEGEEKIPEGVCLFVANHTSSADAPAVVGAIPRRIAMLIEGISLQMADCWPGVYSGSFYSRQPQRPRLGDLPAWKRPRRPCEQANRF